VTDFEEPTATRTRIDSLCHGPTAGAALKTAKFCVVLWGRSHARDYIPKTGTGKPPILPITLRKTLGYSLCITTVLVALACKRKSSDEITPTEPWLKEDANRRAKTAPAFARYSVRPGSTLAFSLPTRTHKPGGLLHGIHGHVDLDPRDLAKSHGLVTFDLRELKMNEVELSVNATSEALRWIGLGDNVSLRDVERNKSAAFEFHSLRSLSHPSVHLGTLVRTESHAADQGTRRQIQATLDGDLTIRGLSVKRSIPVTLLFALSDKDALPSTIEVRLRGSVSVPLSEYEIAPRGPEGHLISEKQNLLGKEVGSQVQVTGALELEKTGAPR
jgi:polyisoprenoid-binding protein YceI